MSWRHPAWDVLGIDPTTDQTAIRRAYAARLKAIDPDRDPDAFIALRDALEQARDEARWADYEDEEEEEEEEEGEQHAPAFVPDAAVPAEPTPAPPAPPLPEPAPPPPPRGPWAPLTPADHDAHAGALLELLDRPEDEADAPVWPDPEQTEAMLAHWRVLSRDPRLQQMGHFADVEQWFAGLIARSSPFSDPLVVPVSEFFGWMAAADQLGQSPAVAFVAQRRRALDFASEASRPGHPLHRAWVELTTPAGERARRGRVPRKDVEALLATVRRDVPDVEGNFDGYRVALWEKKKDWGAAAGIFWWIFVVVVIQGFRLTACASDQPPPPVPVVVGPAGLRDADADIDRALLLGYDGKLSLAVIDAKNPDLAAALRRHWQSNRDDGAAWAGFALSVGTLLDQRYKAGLAQAPLDVLRAHQRYEVAEIEWMRSVDPEICAQALQGHKFETDLPIPPTLSAQRKAMVVQVLLETRPAATPRAMSTSFAIPSDLVERAARRAGMTPEAFGRAMRFEGPARAQCGARIAFIETVLALPAKRAEPLLRAM